MLDRRYLAAGFSSFAKLKGALIGIRDHPGVHALQCSAVHDSQRRTQKHSKLQLLQLTAFVRPINFWGRSVIVSKSLCHQQKHSSTNIETLFYIRFDNSSGKRGMIP